MANVEFNNDYYQINNIVREWLADNDKPDHYYAKMLSFALKGLRQLSLHHWQDVQTILLTVDSRHTATLPENYVNWTKVGLKIGQYIKTIAVNGEMHKMIRSDNEETVETLPLYEMPNGIESGQYSGYQFLNYNGTNLFGVGGGLPSKGHFQVIKRGDTTYEMTFDYDVNIGSKMVVEYISDGFNPNGQSVVNALCHDYIYKTMDFAWEKKFNLNRTEASIMRYGRDLNDAERLVRASQNDLDPATILTLSRRETRFTPKI